VGTPVAFLLCGAWVDDKVVVTADEGLYDSWFLPVLNERSITNDASGSGPSSWGPWFADILGGFCRFAPNSLSTFC
jgi:hypothetical protein